MEKKQKNINFLFSQFLLYTMILGILYSLLGFHFYEKEIDYKLEELVANEKIIINAEKERLSRTVANILGDLMYLVDNFEMHFKNNKNSACIQNNWRSFSKNKICYDQIRYLDTSGQEIMRVNYNPELKDGLIVPQEKLQNKAERYYFTNSIIIDHGDIFVSPLDLNIENGQIEQPLKPMIRIASPVVFNNEKIGIIILNYKAEKLIEGFNELRTISAGELSLLNIDGYYLSHVDKEKTWGFMYPEKTDSTIAVENPKLYAMIQENDSGILFDESGMHLFAKMDLMTDAEHLSNQLFPSKKPWIIVSTIRHDGKFSKLIEKNIGKKIYNFITDNYKVYTTIVLLAFLLSVIASIKNSDKQRMKMYSEIDSLTATYNRRAGYKYLKKSYERAKANGERMSICFMDINGLKDINDNLGHDHGDNILISVVQSIKEVIRSTDILIRLGGDEFLLALPRATCETSEEIWSRIKEKFETINKNENRPYIISVSHGIVELDNTTKESLAEQVAKADQLMYAEKKIIKKDIVVLRTEDTVIE